MLKFKTILNFLKNQWLNLLFLAIGVFCLFNIFNNLNESFTLVANSLAIALVLYYFALFEKENLKRIKVTILNIKLPFSEKTNKIIINIFNFIFKKRWEIISYLFLFLLLIITLGNFTYLEKFIDLAWIKKYQTILTILAIATGGLTFWHNQERIEKETEIEKDNEEKAEEKRKTEFYEKFPKINKVPVLRSLVKWMYKKGWSFSVPLIIISIIFIAIKIGVPIIYTGSYIDEYFHIFSGIEFFKTGHFAEIYHGSYYTRGAYISFIAGLFLKLFGKKIFIIKLIPAFLGIINFYLLYRIAKKINIKKNIILIIMFIYTISPWIIINHFYLRMYVFYEFFILVITFYLFKIIKIIKKNKKNKKNICASLLFIFIFNMLFYLFGNDVGIYIILIFESIAFSYVYLFEFNNLITNKKIFILILKSYYFKIIILTVITSIFIIIFNKLNLLNYFLHAHAKYTTPDNMKLSNFFFETNALISILFFISFLNFLLSKNRQMSFLPISSFILLILHLFSSKDIQTTRAILYFLPLFYLMSFSVLRALNSKKRNAIIYLLIFLTVLNNYPPRFLQTPYIPKEINYINNDIYEVVKDKCRDKLLITSSRPIIAFFLNVYPDYYLNTQYIIPCWENDEEYSLSFFASDNNYYDSATKIPLIIDLETLKKIVSENNKICYLEGALPTSWVNQETKYFLYSNFKLENTYKSNTYSSEMKLYIKEM